MERHAKRFANGGSQAVRIPREFELPGKTVTIMKKGERLIIEPVAGGSLLEWLRTIEPWDEPFPEIADRPAEPVDI